MTCYHILLMVIVIAIMLIYKEFFKNRKLSKMFLRIGFVNDTINSLELFVEKGQFFNQNNQMTK